jgi:hypothetical protein
MKKIFLSLGALFTFGIASAQIDPKQAPVPSTPPSTTKAETDNTIKPVELSKDAVDKGQKPDGEVQPRKDEIKTQDHVKSTPKPEAKTDTVKAVKKNTRKRKS